MAIQTGNKETFYPDIRKMEPTDSGHADTFNPLFKVLIDNSAFLNAVKVDKTEVDGRIKELIGAAPAALDTLKELADALNNDPNFSATMTNELSKKVDKMTGKQLSTEDFTTAEKNKLSGVETGANKYTHPSTHPATIITEDPSRRFVSDVEKAAWNAKETVEGAQAKATKALSDAKSYTSTEIAKIPATDISGKVDKVAGKDLSTEDYTTAEKTKLSGVENGANKYVHPSTHPASIISESTTKRFVTDAQIAAWNEKQGAVGYTPSRCESGTYTGNDIANRAISLGFQAKYVKVIGNGSAFELYPSLSQLTPEVQALDGKNYTLNDGVNIGAITAVGFTLGTGAANKANKTGQTYTYIAIG